MRVLPLFMASSDSDAVTGLFSGVFGLFLLVLGIAWLIFPFIVISKFNELLRVQRHATLQIQDAVARIAMIQQGKTDTVKAHSGCWIIGLARDRRRDVRNNRRIFIGSIS